jgi:glycerol-3-phosphate O-acyltransferase/dihydroxyacetone phosphate acyltransferase
MTMKHSNSVLINTRCNHSLINMFVRDESKKCLADNLYAYKCELNDMNLRDSDLVAYKQSSLISGQIAKDFIKKSLSILADLPLFLPVLMAHLPIYIISYEYSKDEEYEEVKAQDKILYGTVAVPFIYFLLFLWEWYYLYKFTRTGFLFSIITLVIFFWLHIVSIDQRYEAFKQWLGQLQLFNAFVLNRGNRKKRILEILKIRESAQKELLEIFCDKNDSHDDNIQHVVEAIRLRENKFI